MFKIHEKQRLIVLVSVVLVAGFVATSLASYYVSKSAMRDSMVKQTLPLTSDNVYSEIQRDLLRPIFISSMMAHDTFLRDWALGGEKDVDAVTRYLAEIMKKYGTFTSFFISEKTRLYYHSTGILKKVVEGVPIDMWYFRVREMAPEYEINVDPDEILPGVMTIYINYRMYDYRGNYIGATGVGLSMDHVRNLIEQYRSRYLRNIFFVDRKGALMLTGSPVEAPPRKILEEPGYRDIAKDILATDHGSYQYRRGSETVLLNSRFIPELQWYLLVEQAEDPLLTEMRQTLWGNLVICALITLVVLAATRFTVNRYQERVDGRTEELKAAKEVAENATRIKDNYVSLVSHNLRGPLSTIKGYLQIALQEKNADGSFKPDIEEWLKHSHNVADGLIEATGKILDISRLQSGKMELFKTCFRAQHVAKRKLEHAAHLAVKKHITLANEVPDTLRIVGDRDLVGEALMNLVTNAIKFTRDGGTVTVFSPAANIIAVRDTGVGVHPSMLSGLFRHGVMTTSPGTAGEGGTGLGLPYSYDIMKAHGGDIKVETSDAGSVFSLVFLPGAHGVLILDDDGVRRAQVKEQLLAMTGIEAMEAANVQQALSLAAGKSPFMVLLGVDGGADGALEVAKAVRASQPPTAVPVVVYSSSAVPAEEEFANAGVNDIVPNFTTNQQDFILRLRRYFP